MRRRIWGKRGAGEVKGRTALRRARIVLAFGVLLGAGLMTSGALGDTGFQGIFTSSGSATDTTFSSGPSGTNTLSLLTLNPTIDSDQADYNPGDTVTLTGHNWAPAEPVHIFVNDDEGRTWSYNGDVAADLSGDFA